MFIERLKYLRQENNISQKQLADLFNISQQAVASWENGKNTPNPDAIVKLANYFDVSTDYLLGRNENDTMLKLSDNEQSLISEYRKLDSKKKTIALAEIYKLSE